MFYNQTIYNYDLQEEQCGFFEWVIEGMPEVVLDNEANLGVLIETLRNKVDNLALQQCKLKVATFGIVFVSFLVFVLAIIVFLAKQFSFNTMVIDFIMMG